MKLLGLLLSSAILVSCDRAQNTADSEQVPENQRDTMFGRHGRGGADASSEISELAERLTMDLQKGNMTYEDLIGRLESDETKTIAAMALLDGELDYQLIRNVLLEYYDKAGPKKGLRALALLDGQPTIATPLLGEMLMKYHALEPDQSLDWLKKNSYLSGAPNAAVILGQALGDSDEPAALVDDLLTSVEDEAIRDNLLIGIAGVWIGNDFNEAFEHFSELADGRLPDRLFYELVSKGNQVDAGNTMAWAEVIKNPGLQRSAIYETAIQWNSTDFEAYKKWKSEAKISKDLLKELP